MRQYIAAFCFIWLGTAALAHQTHVEECKAILRVLSLSGQSEDETFKVLMKLQGRLDGEEKVLVQRLIENNRLRYAKITEALQSSGADCS